MAAFQPDVVHIQHEYGLYGPDHGVAIIPLLYRLKLASIPIIVTLHTVYDSFSQHQKLITEAICRIADAIIVHEEYQRKSIGREIFPFQAMVNKVNCGFIAYSDQDFVDYIGKIISHSKLAESLSKNAKDYVKKHLSCLAQ